ncbi:Putative hydroxylase/desaturase AsaB [Septoria linicola]|uniref:Hydroxylase/desaturase AsaB n=1 Tax=Septoria linicola TaxID=215465 RepID=A0A9Q9EL71_9PEZI|nr:putative hydroxylase/desaturase AsaB [Septoria linicola]USW54795.1 Putative hydroxylase/desaturase AsaB [Septoria linicola]
MSFKQNQHAIFRFVEPDLTIPAYDRAIFANPRPKRLEQLELPLHDFRTSTEVARGFEGLDQQGFTYIEHASSLTPDEMLAGRNAEDKLAPEVLEMMAKLTGAKRGVVHSIGFRRIPASKQQDLDFVPMRGSEIDQQMEQIPKDGMLVNGRHEQSASEPARQCHVDTTLEGLRRTLQFSNTEIAEAAKNIMDAEALRKASHDVEVPRYAAYSVWRPLKTVKRDPIAVADYRTLDPDDLVATENRIPSGINAEGDYIIEAYTGRPPKQPVKQKWYWVPEQKPNEVLIIKFADSAAETDPSIAACGLHASPVLPGTEEEEVRQSSEVRVYMFWE